MQALGADPASPHVRALVAGVDHSEPVLAVRAVHFSLINLLKMIISPAMIMAASCLPVINRKPHIANNIVERMASQT